MDATLSRNELVEAHDYLCQQIVKCLFRRKVVKGLEFEDVLQEARYALVQAADSFNPARGAQFVTHATTCITNLLRDELRRWGRKVQTSDFDDVEEQLGEAAPDQGFEAIENKLFIQQAMDALPPQQRQVIDLLYLQSMPQADVAAHMNLSDRQVRNLRDAGLAAMRQMAEA